MKIMLSYHIMLISLYFQMKCNEICIKKKSQFQPRFHSKAHLPSTFFEIVMGYFTKIESHQVVTVPGGRGTLTVRGRMKP